MKHNPLFSRWRPSWLQQFAVALFAVAALRGPAPLAVANGLIGLVLLAVFIIRGRRQLRLMSPLCRICSGAGGMSIVDAVLAVNWEPCPVCAFGSEEAADGND